MCCTLVGEGCLDSEYVVDIGTSDIPLFLLSVTVRIRHHSLFCILVTHLSVIYLLLSVSCRIFHSLHSPSDFIPVSYLLITFFSFSLGEVLFRIDYYKYLHPLYLFFSESIYSFNLSILDFSCTETTSLLPHTSQESLSLHIF